MGVDQSGTLLPTGKLAASRRLISQMPTAFAYGILKSVDLCQSRVFGGALASIEIRSSTPRDPCPEPSKQDFDEA